MADAIDGLAWDDLRLVKAIADARGMSGAAAALGLNHSTVFRRLGQIESALGATLFERRRSGYGLTPAGEEMARLADSVDGQITAFTRKLAGGAIAPAGELRVTTADSLLSHLLTPLFGRFQKAYPDVRLDVVTGNVLFNLSKRDADVAIRATDHPPETLVGRRVARIAWALYGRVEDFPNGEAPSFEALRERSWATLGDELGALNVVTFAHTRVPAANLRYRVNTVLGLADAVEAGLGIGHLPCLFGDVRPGLMRLAEPETDFAADLWLLTHADLRQSPRVRVFLDFMAAELAALKPLIEGVRSPVDAPDAPRPTTGSESRRRR